MARLPEVVAGIPVLLAVEGGARDVVSGLSVGLTASEFGPQETRDKARRAPNEIVLTPTEVFSRLLITGCSPESLVQRIALISRRSAP